MIGRLAWCTTAGVLAAWLSACATSGASDRVIAERLPEGGVGPQAVVDSDGVVHIAYFVGDPLAGDVFYVQRRSEGAYSAPRRVNSQPGSAVVKGTIRGPQLALGRSGRVHVVWNGSEKVQPRPRALMPVLYTRATESSDAFEPQRNLAVTVTGADGGATIAADRNGSVFVAWHTGETTAGDAQRAVVLARSSDDGLRFDAARRVSPPELGACACCNMRGLVDRTGAILLLYRAAADNVHRDITLLTSRDRGETFSSERIDPWNIGACPMSSMSMADGPRGVVAAWETEGRIRFGFLSGARMMVSPSERQGGKHPVLAHNAAGEMLIAWVEGTSPSGGERGSVRWRLVDADGRLTSDGSAFQGLPSWGLAAAAPLPGNRFLVIY